MCVSVHFICRGTHHHHHRGAAAQCTESHKWNGTKRNGMYDILLFVVLLFHQEPYKFEQMYQIARRPEVQLILLLPLRLTQFQCLRLSVCFYWMTRECWNKWQDKQRQRQQITQKLSTKMNFITMKRVAFNYSPLPKRYIIIFHSLFFFCIFVSFFK